MSGRRPVLIAAVASVVVTAVFFMLLLRPKLNQIAETREQTLQAQQEEQQLQQDLARLQQVRKDAPETRAKLARVSDLLPSTPELPSFIRLVQSAATAESIDLKSIAPSPPSTVDEQLDSVSVSLLIEGSFHRTEAFLARLEGLKRLVEVTSIAVAPAEDPATGGFTLSTTLSIKMYVFKGTAA